MLYFSQKKLFSRPSFRRSVPGTSSPSSLPPKEKHPWNWKRIAQIGGWTALAGFIATLGLFLYIAKDLPSPGNVRDRFIAESTKIYDRSGAHLLYEVHGEEKRTVIPFSDMPDVVKYATISLEDQDFYNHFGIKFSSIARAIFKDIITLEKAEGGSTITQQLVKNTLLSNEKSIIRKVKEVILAIELETKYSKDEILEMYLNEIPYGSNAYGIEAAAQTFFGKPARELGLDEATLLAALPQATTYYSPYGSHTEALSGRQSYALRQMARLGYITDEQAEEAVNADTLAKIAPQKDIIAAPHFVMYIKDYLQEKYGDRSVEEGGYRVTTTLDWDKQLAAEEAIRTGAEKNARYKAKNAALVAIDPKTGQILSMVGSKDYFDTSIDGQVNVTIRERQPGSSFKPYVYLTAFMKGYIPETLMYDVETEFDTAEGKSYKPQNYDGKFRGPLSMAESLAQSLNIPAVKTLYLVGVKEAINTAKSLGVQGLNDPDRLGLSLVLGGGEVKLLDHVHAYATLANGGVKQPLAAILKIEDPRGSTLEEFQSGPGERVIEEKYVTMLEHIMSTNSFRTPAFGENSPLRFDNRDVAAKTGTTNEFRDGWTLGFTPSLAIGVWAGNNDNSSMAAGADGVIVAAPIWRSFLDKALVNYATERFPKYEREDIEKPMLGGELEDKKDLKVCEIPGEDDKYCLANKYCPGDESEKKDFVDPHDILHYVKRDDPRGDQPEKPENDGQYKNWEKAVKEWYKKQKGVVAEEAPEKECSEDDFKKYRPSISLSVPGSTNSSSVTLTADVNAPYGVSKVVFSVEGEKVGERNEKPYAVSYSIPASQNNSTIDVEVTVEDRNGNTSKSTGSISVAY
ncbi:MAG: penicillin-binding protein [Candidatus Moraniibacteriota bacterium]|nr:MAG: penicillin-binding protein [Candidatus Moranbacteria bacterium]